MFRSMILGITFNGHKTGVTCLSFDQEGHRLASGSRDTNIIVWDIVNECGLYRLKGHKGPITSLSFDNERNVLVSSSKDTLVKFWDLNVQHCFKTLTEHIMEVWDFILVKDYIVTGTSDAELRVFKLQYSETAEANFGNSIEPHMKKLKVLDEEDENQDDEDQDEFDAGILKIERVGSLLRQGQDKVAHLVVDSEERLIACHGSNDSNVELFAICSDDEVKKRLQKRAKKERRKNGSASANSEATDLPSPTIQEEFRRLKVFKGPGKIRHMQVSFRKDVAEILIGKSKKYFSKYSIPNQVLPSFRNCQ